MNSLEKIAGLVVAGVGCLYMGFCAAPRHTGMTPIDLFKPEKQERERVLYELTQHEGFPAIKFNYGTRTLRGRVVSFYDEKTREQAMRCVDDAITFKAKPTSTLDDKAIIAARELTKISGKDYHVSITEMMKYLQK